jgi:protein-tyrosine-phosphatase
MAMVLFVCTGNLCRSPMAAALLQRKLARDAQRRDWVVISAGTWASAGLPASEYAVEELAARGCDLSAHGAQTVTGPMLEQADLVLVMTTHHAEALRSVFPACAGKVHLLSAMVGGRYDIGDPYGGQRAEYAQSAAELERLIDAGYERIVALAAAQPAG